MLADQTPPAADQNGGVFDRDQYLKEEGFEDVEVRFLTESGYLIRILIGHFLFSQGCGGRSQLGQARPEAGARGEVVLALRPAMGEGLFATSA